MNAILTNADNSTDHVPGDAYTELLIGAGRNKKRLLALGDREGWENLITLDIDESLNPDVVHDLNVLPYPFNSDEFDEIHAYEVLEHCGTQGDWRFFFAQFDEFARILKPGGLFFGTVPNWDSVHAWADPGHCRIINEATLSFLIRSNYEDARLPTTDYRPFFKSDWTCEHSMRNGERFVFCLRVVK